MGCAGRGDLVVLVLQCSARESYSQQRVCVEAETKVEPTGWKVTDVEVENAERESTGRAVLNL